MLEDNKTKGVQPGYIVHQKTIYFTDNSFEAKESQSALNHKRNLRPRYKCRYKLTDFKLYP